MRQSCFCSSCSCPQTSSMQPVTAKLWGQLLILWPAPAFDFDFVCLMRPVFVFWNVTCHTACWVSGGCHWKGEFCGHWRGVKLPGSLGLSTCLSLPSHLGRGQFSRVTFSEQTSHSSPTVGLLAAYCPAREPNWSPVSRQALTSSLHRPCIFAIQQQVWHQKPPVVLHKSCPSLLLAPSTDSLEKWARVCTLPEAFNTCAVPSHSVVRLFKDHMNYSSLKLFYCPWDSPRLSTGWFAFPSLCVCTQHVYHKRSPFSFTLNCRTVERTHTLGHSVKA